ncbi:hypothetical protein D3C74_374990 [compost metagenome]
MGDARVLNQLVIKTQVSIISGIARSVALRILEHECRFSCINVRGIFTASGQGLVKSRLISAIGGGDHRSFELHIRFRMDFHILLGHVRNLIREAPEIDGDFLTIALCWSFGSACSWGCSWT